MNQNGMNQTRALEVVRSLANGVDPDTGEVFAAESPYQRPETVRALFVAAQALEQREKTEKRRESLPAKTGAPWTEDEDRTLLAGFDAGRAIAELALEHQRTQHGVRSRLLKYGRLTA